METAKRGCESVNDDFAYAYGRQVDCAGGAASFLAAERERVCEREGDYDVGNEPEKGPDREEG